MELALNLSTLNTINAIIERDSKDSTYKFALLRATIEAIQERIPYIKKTNEWYEIPTGILIFKWIEYYYTIIEYELPQRNGDKISENSLAFRSIFKGITDHYSKKGNGLSQMYNDLIKGNIDKEIADSMLILANKIHLVITDKPMRHIGMSVFNEQYAIFKKGSPKMRISTGDRLSKSYLLEKYGTFLLREYFYHAFEILAGLITGTNSIIYNWAEFTSQKSRGNMSVYSILDKINTRPVQDRDSSIAKQILKQIESVETPLYCVWSGEKIIMDLNIEHTLPFSIWRNNDLWNLLPSKNKVNSNKSDKIPSSVILDRQRDLIIHYWEIYRRCNQTSFDFQITGNLVMENDLISGNWQSIAFESFKDKCEYLINSRGYEAWEWKK